MNRSVLHIDTEPGWRGGENQLRLLLQHAPAGWRWHLAAEPGSAVAGRLAAVAAVTTLPMRGLRQATAAATLARLVRREGIGLIDCHTGRAHTVGLLVKALVPECRLVVHRRVAFAPGTGPLHRAKYLSDRVDLFVCISERIAGVLQEYGVPAERVTVVRSGADSQAFTAVDRTAARAALRARWGLSEGTAILGCAGHLSAVKDQATLLRALGRLRGQGADIFCWVAGAGPDEGALRAQAAALGLDEGRLRLLGQRDDVPDLMAGSDVFALTPTMEGLGTVLLDAAAAGCALVGTDTGGIPEIVQDGRSGLLVGVGDDAGLAAALGRLAGDDVLRAELAAGARALVTGPFAPAAMAAGNVAIYENLLAARAARC